MPRRIKQRAREAFPDWAERPCSEEWEAREYPCPWYRFGRNCDRPWSDLTHPADYYVLSLLYIAVIIAFVVLCYYMYASRKKRCDVLVTPGKNPSLTPQKKYIKRHNKSLVRTISQDALLLNADGSERFVWSSYNDYERAILWTMCVCIIQLITYIDPNGFYRILSLPFRQCTYGGLRIFVNLTLFQMAAGYRKALKPAGTPRDWGVVIGAVLATGLQAVTLTLESTQAPKGARRSCAHSGWNFFRHFGASFLEFIVIFLTLRYALSVREKLKGSKSADTRHGRLRLRAAVDQIITRTFLLCAITFIVMGWNAFVGARQADSRYSCHQPACTFPAFFSTIFYAVLYVATTWFGVIFFGVGLPPPINCYGSKPTISAVCCCCPRPAWLAPDAHRLSYSSSVDDSNESTQSSDNTQRRVSFLSTTSRPLYALLWSLFFGDSAPQNNDNNDHAGDGTPIPQQNESSVDEEALFRDSEESRDETQLDTINSEWKSKIDDDRDRIAFTISPDEIHDDVDQEAALDYEKNTQQPPADLSTAT